MSANLLSDKFDNGDPYERYMGRWSRRIAPFFLDWLEPEADLRWLDVGCGTGALCASIVDGCSPSEIFGVEPSPAFRRAAQGRLGAHVTFLAGSATSLPLEGCSVDVTVSALMLNFVSDPSAALREMIRVTRPGGTIGAYVWDYAVGMQMIRIFWDAVAALDPNAAHLDEATRFPLCRREPLAQLFKQAGLTGIDTASLEMTMRFEDFEDFWQPFLGGQGPAPTYVASLIEPARTRLRDSIRGRLPVAADGTIELRALAWAVRGAVPDRVL